MFDYLVTFRRDGHTFREVVIADSPVEARYLFEREHPTLLIVSIKLITD
jgi:hypothetical protein